MADPTRVDPLAALRELLIRDGGGFLRNARWQPDLTCTLCAGVPGNNYPTCYNCETWQHRTDLADRLGFVSYAVQGAQSGTVMYGYKDVARPSEANRRVVTMMHHYAVARHWTCIHSSALGPATHWATVPSLGTRQGPHPLEQISSPFLDKSLPSVALSKAPGAVNMRDLRPQNFVASVPHGAHVLLIEDTWVGGGRVQSAAAALKRDGAKSVTALVLARWLEPSRGRTAELLASLRDVDFNPDRCPFTGSDCLANPS